MFLSFKCHKAAGKFIIIAILAVLLAVAAAALTTGSETVSTAAEKSSETDSYITWAEFNVSFEALDRALNLDIKSQSTETPTGWIDILSCAAVKHGGNLKNINLSELDKIAEELAGGKTPYEIAGEGSSKYFDYYKEVYEAVLGGFLGYYSLGIPSDDGDTEWELRYGLKAYSPIAEGFYYSHYDDFGNSRTYGYSRPHLGNDIMGSTGTPVIAVESGVVESLGWNQYGGWRIGIRSFDKKRYYYYAHLMEDTPYAAGLKEGDSVTAGDVIGYMGRTGYSTEENVSNMQKTHLHFGMQLIFDESQKESDNELWIDTYNIVRLLDRHRSTVKRDSESGEYNRVYSIRE